MTPHTHRALNRREESDLRTYLADLRATVELGRASERRVYLDPPMSRWERLVWGVVLLTAAAVLTVGLIAWVTGL